MVGSVGLMKVLSMKVEVDRKVGKSFNLLSEEYKFLIHFLNAAFDV